MTLMVMGIVEVAGLEGSCDDDGEERSRALRIRHRYPETLKPTNPET